VIAYRLCRLVNRLNPTTYGQGRLAPIAERLGRAPRDGQYFVDPGVCMHVRMTDYIERRIYLHAYEVRTVRLWMANLKPGDVVIDVGANVGYYSLAAGRAVGPSGQVHAFEPNPETYRRLMANVALNPAANIRGYPMALADYEGEAVLHVPEDPSRNGHSSLMNQQWDNPQRFRVSVQRLDDVLGGQLTRLDAIKIDAEGAELALLRGGETLMRRFQPAVLVELNAETAASFGYQPLDIVDWLLSIHPRYRFQHIGRVVRTLTIDEMRRQSLQQGNLLAIP
jgi:FkbM family methyltransferase